LARRNYPHIVAISPVNTHQTADPPASLRVGFREEDLDAALAAFDETFDIARGDLSRLLQQVELQATIRAHGDISCADIMSRDVISIDAHADPADARALLLKHNIRTLPVKDENSRLVGTIGLRELSKYAGQVNDILSKAATASENDLAFSLLPVLTDGHAHAVIVIDGEHRIVGLISQTDLLSAAARALPSSRATI
jgi:CBS domain-containing membrane protein